MHPKYHFFLSVFCAIIIVVIATLITYWTNHTYNEWIKFKSKSAKNRRKITKEARIRPSTKFILAMLCAVGVAISGVIVGLWVNYTYSELIKFNSPSTDKISGKILTKKDSYIIYVGSISFQESAEQLKNGINIADRLEYFMAGEKFNFPLHLYFENNRVLFDTYLESSQGTQPVFKIIANEFTFNPDGKYDRNYNFNSLEVVDENLVPQLQIYLKEDNNIYIGGTVKMKNATFYFTPTRTYRKADRKKFPKEDRFPVEIKRLFKYPSYKYLGEREKENTPFEK